MTTPREFLQRKADETGLALEVYFDTLQGGPPSLEAAMRYSLFAGGKRLRAALALGAAELVGGDGALAMPAACALEMIHTYSLVHDDLPAMDDSDLRRGQPTLHKAYGEAMAILAGDTLLTMAFDVAAQSGNAAIVSEIAQAAGARGMAGGQVVDLESEDKELTLDEMKQVHAWKTGALIRVSVRAGAMLGGANQEQLAALTRYGEHIGLAFQIADDILDVVGTEEEMGKPVGADEANLKSTYPGVVGLDESRRLADAAAQAAVDALTPFGSEADTLRGLARYIVERQS